MSAKTVYAFLESRGITLGATREGDSVLVHVVHGGMLGWYNLSRFRDGKVTPATIRELFS